MGDEVQAERIQAALITGFAGGGSEDSALALVMFLRPSLAALEMTREHVKGVTQAGLDDVAAWDKPDDRREVFWMEVGMSMEDRLKAQLRVLDRATAVAKHWEIGDIDPSAL